MSQALNLNILREYLDAYCSAAEASRVGWAVVGMRSRLIAFAAHYGMEIAGDDEKIRDAILGISEELWERDGEAIMEGWRNDDKKRLFWLSRPVPASKEKGGKERGVPRSNGLFDVAESNTAIPVGQPVQDEELPDQAADSAGTSKARKAKKISPSDLLEADFQRFWAAYPKKVAIERAREAFIALDLKVTPLERLIVDASLRSYTADWSKKDGAFIPHPATYLNQRRWEDPLALTEVELAASTLPTEKERRAFFAKGYREIESWVSTQRLLEAIPSQDDLLRHLGLSGGSGEQAERIVETEDGIVIDAMPIREVPGRALVTTEMAVAATARGVEDDFRGKLMIALEGMSEERQRRILAKPEREQRDWLALWEAANMVKFNRANQIQAAMPAPPPLPAESPVKVAAPAGDGDAKAPFEQEFWF